MATNCHFPLQSPQVTESDIQEIEESDITRDDTQLLLEKDQGVIKLPV